MKRFNLKRFKFIRQISSASALGLYSLAALPCVAEPPIFLSEIEKLVAQVSPEAPAVQSDSEAPQSQPTQEDSGSNAADTNQSDAASSTTEEVPTVQSNVIAPCPAGVPVAATDNPAPPSTETVAPLTGPVIPYPTEATPETVTALTAPVVPIDQSAGQESAAETPKQTATKVSAPTSRPVIIAVPSAPRRSSAKAQGTLPEPPPADGQSVEIVPPSPAAASTIVTATGPTATAPQPSNLPVPDTTSTPVESSPPSSEVTQSPEVQTTADPKIASLCPPGQETQTATATGETNSKSPDTPAKKNKIIRAIENTRKSLRNVRPF